MSVNRIVFFAAFAVGLLAVAWVGAGFVGSNGIALAMTAAIAAAYLLGAQELRRFRAATAGLAQALAELPQPPARLDDWLGRVPAPLRQAVQLRIEGDRSALPGPALTPYLVGLLVMLGMLGTFLGLVVTFKGTVFALEGSADLRAIRSALAAPIRGLGLAFGTSVAGVAASAALGLMSATSRRERLDATRQLDGAIAGALRPFSPAHQREEALRALQAQAGALPALVDRLQAMTDGLETRSRQLDERLLEQQERFHREASAAYTGLADTVGESLKDSLAAGARMAGESIRPVVQEAMAEIAQDTRRMHQHQLETAQAQLQALSAGFEASARNVSETWNGALREHARTGERLAAELDRTLAAFAETFERRSGALVARIDETLSSSQAEQAALEQQRLQAWTQTLEATAAGIAAQAGEQARRTLGEIERLLAGSEALVRSRIDAEAAWLAQHAERLDALDATIGERLDALNAATSERLGTLNTAISEHLATLNAATSERLDALHAATAERLDTLNAAAGERLGALQAAAAGQLAALGSALEAPMTRLLESASEAPRAAAEVIAELRQQMSRLAERDRQTLDGQAGVAQALGELLRDLGETAARQRAAIGALADGASQVLAEAGDRFSASLEQTGSRFSTTLEQTGSRFSASIDAQAGKAADAAVQLTASAIELSSLGEAFRHGVQLFSDSNARLLEQLQRIEETLARSIERSDEQLAYYVAQAREVIDLSISSQQGIVEDLRRLRGQPAAAAGEQA